MPMADQEFPWDHKEQAVVVPLRDDAPADDGPPAWMDEVPPEPQEEDGDLPGVVNPASWGEEKAPHRRFIIPGWIVRGAAGLLSGQEGVGKSLLAQQMATCAAIGRNFLGLEIEQVPAVYVTCEDPMDELRRRQESINAALGITMADLDGKLLLVSLQGEIGNELATFDQAGRIYPAKRFRQLQRQLTEFGAGLAFFDNAAHFFTGNENARHDVAAFLSLLERLSIAMDGAIVLLAHPNKAHAQGNTQGNEYSGSTGWSAHVRNRLFLDWATQDGDGNPIDDDGRLLRKSKANYGKKGEEIHFIWHEWAFTTLNALPTNTASQIARAAEDAATNEIFLRCLDRATAERRNTSASRSGSNYAPRIFSTMTAAKGVTLEQLEAAMNRLFHLELIRNDQPLWQRKNRVWVTGIKRTNPRTNPHQPSDGNTAESGTLDNESKDLASAQSSAPSIAPTMHQPAPSSLAQVHQPSFPPLKGRGLEPHPHGDGDEALEHDEIGEPPAWMDEARAHDPDWMDNPVLNRDF